MGSRHWTSLGTSLAAAAAIALGTTLPASAQSPDEALAALADQVLSTGPGGEDPAPASSVELSDDELAKITEMNATAAIAARSPL